MTPLSNIPSRISTRRNPERLCNPLPDPERFIRESLNKKTSRRILEYLGDQSISDIHHIFEESHTQPSTLMSDFFKPLEFSQIAGAPHAILGDAVKKLPTFQGNNAMTAKSHLWKFEKHLVSYCIDAANDHDDVKMKLFSLSLEEDVG